jgi:hypothetical protein
MLLKIPVIADPMIRKASLPDRQTRLQSKRESSLDELHRPLQRYFIRRRNQRMEVVRHDHVFMQEIFALYAIVEENINEQVSGGGVLK